MEQSRTDTASKTGVSQLHTGESVVLSLGTANVRCMVFYTAGQSAILTPTQAIPTLQSALSELPAKGVVQTDGGRNLAFTIRSNGAIQALAGELHSEPVSNRRSSYRVKIDFQVKVSSDGQHWYPVRGEDISEGGLRFNNPGFLRLSPDQMLLLSIQLPDCEPISASGTVRRINFESQSPAGGPSKVGVQFSALSPNEQRKLVQFIYKFQSQLGRGHSG